ncbi:hypothetical protein BD414DRAFT_314383 [Trametes punicea]|nr:hypothetical protein BD414DRAFT_314383 [Trametes punicea]
MSLPAPAPHRTLLERFAYFVHHCPAGLRRISPPGCLLQVLHECTVARGQCPSIPQILHTSCTFIIHTPVLRSVRRPSVPGSLTRKRISPRTLKIRTAVPHSLAVSCAAMSSRPSDISGAYPLLLSIEIALQLSRSRKVVIASLSRAHGFHPQCQAPKSVGKNVHIYNLQLRREVRRCQTWLT